MVTESLVQRAVADLPALGAEAAAIAKAAGGTRGRKAWVLAGLLAGTTAAVALASWELAAARRACGVNRRSGSSPPPLR